MTVIIIITLVLIHTQVYTKQFHQQTQMHTHTQAHVWTPKCQVKGDIALVGSIFILTSPSNTILSFPIPLQSVDPPDSSAKCWKQLPQWLSVLIWKSERLD